jgi:hypothetical protein
MDVPSSSPVAGARPADPIDVVQPLLSIAGWIRFLAVLAIVAGVLQCLTCVGLLFGWIPIWVGVLLLRSVDRLERGRRSGDAGELRAGIESLAGAMQVKAALALISIVLTLIALLAMSAMILGLLPWTLPQH